jgi:hypothetical protein
MMKTINICVFLSSIIKYNKYSVFSYVAVAANKRFVKIFTPPCHVAHEEFSANLRVTFKYFFWIVIQQLLWEVFSFQVQLMFSIFRLGLFYNEVLLDTVI